MNSIRKLDFQSGKGKEGLRGNNSTYHAFRVYVFFFLCFPPGLAHVTRSKANSRHRACQVTHHRSPPVTGSTGVEESENGKSTLLASKEIRVANASCSASHLEHEVEELAAASWWESSFPASTAPAGWVSEIMLPV